MIAHFAQHPPAAGPGPGAGTETGPATPAAITDREREILTLVGLGRSNAEIAAELFITPATAKTYISRLLTKLNARDRIHLVIIASESGLVGRL